MRLPATHGLVTALLHRQQPHNTRNPVPRQSPVLGTSLSPYQKPGERNPLSRPLSQPLSSWPVFDEVDDKGGDKGLESNPLGQAPARPHAPHQGRHIPGLLSPPMLNLQRLSATVAELCPPVPVLRRSLGRPVQRSVRPAPPNRTRRKTRPLRPEAPPHCGQAATATTRSDRSASCCSLSGPTKWDSPRCRRRFRG